MFQPDVVLRAGDRYPSITKTFTVDGVAVNLTGGSVVFRMAPVAGGALVVDQPATIVTPLAGEVRYDWVSGDTSLTPGFYFGRFEATLSGRVLTAPNDGWLIVHVTGVDEVGWSYSGDPSLRDLDWVRFNIGDTDPTQPILSDAEIESLLVEEGSKWWAAAVACEMGAATFTAKAVASKSVGDLSISYEYGARADSWTQRGKRLAIRAARHTGVAPAIADADARLTAGRFDNA